MSPAALAIIAATLLHPASTAAEVVDNMIHETYRVVHTPGKSLAASISAVSPIREEGKTFLGHTKWRINWHFRWNKSSTGHCAIISTKTTINLTVTTPELLAADSAARIAFDKFRQRLLFHEDGHVRIARETAKTIDHSIRKLASQSDCKQLESTANSIGHRLLEQGNQRSRDYDRLTSHGRTQGAWLP